MFHELIPSRYVVFSSNNLIKIIFAIYTSHNAIKNAILEIKSL